MAVDRHGRSVERLRPADLITTERSWTLLVWALVVTALVAPLLLLDLAGIDEVAWVTRPAAAVVVVLFGSAILCEAQAEDARAEGQSTGPAPQIDREGFWAKVVDGLLFCVTAVPVPERTRTQESNEDQHVVP